VPNDVPRCVEISPGHGKRRGNHAGQARLDLVTGLRLAAAGICNRALGQDRRDPFFSSGTRHQQETLCCRTVDGRGGNRLDAAGFPLRAFDPSRTSFADDGIDFGSFVFGPPITDRN
jgi:hypothetical protein